MCEARPQCKPSLDYRRMPPRRKEKSLASDRCEIVPGRQADRAVATQRITATTASSRQRPEAPCSEGKGQGFRS
jgi:hypothetical protein